ncbi:hypothetical protein Pcinc_018847 [Petrolisthes cinctipes]|uniref:Spaetzle domain-containing protein n=1 Tax=Petrolisthes cinctipes TaxID=88211 RepID=A0AAE1FMW9_PETCI|nr:hypothetical protein Pcinc_018847 [Petrolisthes cinctipes]
MKEPVSDVSSKSSKELLGSVLQDSTEKEVPEEFVKVLGSLAPPPSSQCFHGFCHDHHTSTHDREHNTWWQNKLVRRTRDVGTTFTYSELHSPANDSLFYHPLSPHDRYVCEGEVRQVRPGWGRSSDGSFLKIINTDAFPQRIRMEVCSVPGEPCSFLSQLLTSTCRQRYSVHKMAAVDPNNPKNGVFLAGFKVPSGCFCHVINGRGTQSPQTLPGFSPSLVSSTTGVSPTRSPIVTTTTFGTTKTPRFNRNINSAFQSFPDVNPTQSQLWQQQQQQQQHHQQQQLQLEELQQQQQQQQQLQQQLQQFHQPGQLRSDFPGSTHTLRDTSHSDGFGSPTTTPSPVTPFTASPFPITPLPGTTYHRFTSITISQPSQTITTPSPSDLLSPSSPTPFSPTPLTPQEEAFISFTSLPITTSQLPPSTTAIPFSTSSFPQHITASIIPTSLTTPAPTQSIHQGGFEEFSRDIPLQWSTVAPRRPSGDLKHLGVEAVRDDLHVSKSGDNNFILSLRQVKADGTEVPLELVINVDGQLIQAASNLASTRTAQSRSSTGRIDIDLTNLPHNVKRYVDELQSILHDNQVSISETSDNQRDPLVINNKTSESVALPTNNHLIIALPQNASTRNGYKNLYSPPTALLGDLESLVSSGEHHQISHILNLTTSAYQDVDSPSPKQPQANNNPVTNPVTNKNRHQFHQHTGITSQQHLLPARHNIPSHHFPLQQQQQQQHQQQHLMLQPRIPSQLMTSADLLPSSRKGHHIQPRRHLLTPSFSSHNRRSDSLRPHSASLASSDPLSVNLLKLLGNKSVGNSTNGSPPPGWQLTTQLYADRPHVVQNYFIQVPENVAERNSTNISSGVGGQGIRPSGSEGKNTERHPSQTDLRERLKNHRISPASSLYTMFVPKGVGHTEKKSPMLARIGTLPSPSEQPPSSVTVRSKVRVKRNSHGNAPLYEVPVLSNTNKSNTRTNITGQSIPITVHNNQSKIALGQSYSTKGNIGQLYQVVNNTEYSYSVSDHTDRSYPDINNIIHSSKYIGKRTINVGNDKINVKIRLKYDPSLLEEKLTKDVLDNWLTISSKGSHISTESSKSKPEKNIVNYSVREVQSSGKYKNNPHNTRHGGSESISNPPMSVTHVNNNSPPRHKQTHVTSKWPRNMKTPPGTNPTRPHMNNTPGRLTHASRPGHGMDIPRHNYGPRPGPGMPMFNHGPGFVSGAAKQNHRPLSGPGRETLNHNHAIRPGPNNMPICHHCQARLSPHMQATRHYTYSWPRSPNISHRQTRFPIHHPATKSRLNLPPSPARRDVRGSSQWGRVTSPYNTFAFPSHRSLIHFPGKVSRRPLAPTLSQRDDSEFPKTLRDFIMASSPPPGALVPHQREKPSIAL